MNFSSPRRRTFSALASMSLSFIALLAIGCGDDSGLPTRYKVTGTVKYKGAPVEKGTITFAPEDAANGRSATSTITNGSYSLTTHANNDGALPGKYKVSISSREVDLSKAQANTKGQGSMRQDDVGKAYKDAKKLTPAKYEIAETSGLSFEVKPSSNTYDIDLQD